MDDVSFRGKIGTPMPNVTVQIDPSACILAATCVGIEPKLFQIGQEPHVELTDGTGISHGTVYTFEATAPELEMIEQAVESCPTQAISVQTAI
jgi:ferredoxin